MIEQQGIVLQVREGLVEVEARRSSSCGGCGEKGACATAAIASLLPRRRHRLWLRNTIGAAPGDLVVLGMPDEDVLQLSVSAYLIPVTALILGAGVGEWLARAMAVTSELPVVLAATAGLGAGLALRLVPRGDTVTARVVLLRKEPKSTALVTLI